VSNIIRLKNQAQQMVRALKLEFLSSKVRSEISEPDEIGTMQMKYKVVEYYARVNVLICSNYYGIGHFRKNCPHKGESICKMYAEKCSNFKEHLRSGIRKRILKIWYSVKINIQVFIF
jgi:hypothetical protein